MVVPGSTIVSVQSFRRMNSKNRKYSSKKFKNKDVGIMTRTEMAFNSNAFRDRASHHKCNLSKLLVSWMPSPIKASELRICLVPISNL